jgi:hypothetical protein
MPTATEGPFLVECYRPETSAGWLTDAGRAIDGLGEPTGCRCLTSILVPGDRVAFFLVEGPSPEAVLAVMNAAGIVADRVVASVVGK